ncbi:MAG: hypothetical protein U1E78_09850 [Gammaproteobacteria bacterium]
MFDGVSSSRITELTLSGSFQEMGQQYIAQAGDTILSQFQVMRRKWFDSLEPVELTEFQTKIQSLLMLCKQNDVFYPNEMKRFMNGMAETEFAKNNNLSLDDFIMMDLALFLSAFHPKFLSEVKSSVDHCSYFAITEDRKVGLGRTLDWPKMPMTVLNQNLTILHLQCTEANYPHQVTVMGPAGSISAFTITNEKGLFWAHNSGTTAMHIKSPRFDRPYVAADAVLKMFKCGDFETLKSSIVASPCGYPSIINIAGPGDYEMASIEACPIDPRYPDNLAGFVNILHARGAKNAIHPEDNVKKRGYVATNLVRGDWEKILGKPPAENTPTYARERKMVLEKKINQAHPEGKLMSILTSYLSGRFEGQDPEGVNKVWPPQAPFNDDRTTTHYSVAYVPCKQKLKVSVQMLEGEGHQEHGMPTPWKSIRTSRH